MIQLPTVSADLDSRGRKPFEDFVALIAEQYPLVHANLAFERHTEFGLLFHWCGRRTASDGPLVLMAHYDVVPVDESDDWTYPPFEGRIADGSVYGRGALDDKGPLIVILEAVENLLESGFVPARDVYLSLGGNEETYGSAAQAIAESFQTKGIVPWLVLDEGGAVVDSPLPFVPGRAAMVGVCAANCDSIRVIAFGVCGLKVRPSRRSRARAMRRTAVRRGGAEA